MTSTAAGHTPGPWRVVEDIRCIAVMAGDDEILSQHRYAYGSGDKSIEDIMAGRAFSGDDRAEAVRLNARQMANLRLIAAAPALYEALEWLCEQMEVEQAIGVSGFEDWLKPARAALSLAGEKGK